MGGAAGRHSASRPRAVGFRIALGGLPPGSARLPSAGRRLTRLEPPGMPRRATDCARAAGHDRRAISSWLPFVAASVQWGIPRRLERAVSGGWSRRCGPPARRLVGAVDRVVEAGPPRLRPRRANVPHPYWAKTGCGMSMGDLCPGRAKEYRRCPFPSHPLRARSLRTTRGPGFAGTVAVWVAGGPENGSVPFGRKKEWQFFAPRRPEKDGLPSPVNR